MAAIVTQLTAANARCLERRYSRVMINLSWDLEAMKALEVKPKPQFRRLMCFIVDVGINHINGLLKGHFTLL